MSDNVERERATIKKADPAEILRALRILTADTLDTDAFEVRALNLGRSHRETASGYFRRETLDKAAAAAAKLSNDGAPGVYFCLNPINEALHSRYQDRIQQPAEETTGDKDVVRRFWLLIDIDPKRPAKISSSEAEHEAALSLAQEIKAWLKERGWTDPLEADSGNGAHLLYAVDEPNDDETKKLFERVLKALSLRFSNPAAGVDEKCFNAARISKLYATQTRKGDNTPERPWRFSRLLSVPEQLEPVSRQQLEALAAILPADPVPTRRDSGGTFQSYDLDKFIADYLGPFGLTGPIPYDGKTKFIFDRCPFNEEHKRSAFLLRFPSGAVSFGCHHDSCSGKNWDQLRALFDPKPAASTGRNGAKPRSHKDFGVFQPRQNNGADGGVWNEEQAAPQIVGEKAGDVVEQVIDWNWYPYIAEGKVHVFDGDPGEGKTTLSLAIAAHLTNRAPFPNDIVCDPPGIAVIISAEDDKRDTIVPRLRVAGANLDRIFILNYALERGGELDVLTLPDDISLIEKYLVDVKANMLILDPYSAFIGGKTDSHNDASARRVLAALGQMAQRTNVAVILIRHLNKMGSVDKALYRGGGSIAIGAAARAVYLVAEHPEDSTLPPEQRRRVFACVKTNLAAKPPSLMFRMNSQDGIVFAEWIRERCPLSADDLLRGNERGSEALTNAMSFLTDQLGSGEQPKKVIDAHAKEQGISEATLRRAKKQLKIEWHKEGKFEGGVYWRLPGTAKAKV